MRSSKTTLITLTIALVFSGVLAGTGISAEDSPQREHQKKLIFDMGESLFQEKKYDLAFRQYAEFMDLYPRDRYSVMVLERMAYIYEKKQYFEKAAEVYLELYERKGNTYEGAYYLFRAAEHYNYLGLDMTAEEYMRQILENIPDSPEAQRVKIIMEKTDIPPETSEF
jgi:tetratricopeptide (TPR) repeat protein